MLSPVRQSLRLQRAQRGTAQLKGFPSQLSKHPSRPVSTSSTAAATTPAAASISAAVQEISHHRALLQASYLPEIARVRGVTFEGRQVELQNLQVGTAIQCTWERDNQHDPQAVRIRTLGGADLGYVPRHLTHRFVFDTTFGRVERVLGPGPSEGRGNLGCRVRLSPDMPQLRLTAFPPALRSAADLMSHLPPASCAQLGQASDRRSQHRCTITGLQQPSLRHICTWAADDRTHTLFLTAVLPMLPLIAKAAEQRAQTSTPEDLQVLCAANLWTAEEGASYLHWLASVETARARTRQPWKLDLSWLVDQDIPIPDTLAEHCSPG